MQFSPIEWNDIIVLIVANLLNLVIAAVFWCRKKNYKKIEYALGLVCISMLAPLLFVWGFNIAVARDWWTFVLLVPICIYLIVEFIFDYLLKINFRNSRLLWFYLFFYYIGLWGLIGFAFMVNTTWGYITLATYFVNLAATWFAYSK